MFAYTKVEFVAPLIPTIHPIARRADKVELGIQVSCCDPRFRLATGELSKCGATFSFSFLIIKHMGAVDAMSEIDLNNRRRGLDRQ